MIYIYENISHGFEGMYEQIESSAMTNKNIVWGRWDTDTQIMKLAFEPDLSSEDKVILDGIVEG